MNDILCATDLTRTGLAGVHYAGLIAGKLSGELTLFHVLHGDERRGEEREKAMDLLNAQAADVNVPNVEVKVREGNVIEELTAEAASGYRLFVCGTHGARGLRQELLGSDILKLVRKVKIPALIVQKESPTTLPNIMSLIVLPVAAHKDINPLMKAVCILAKGFGSTVHIFQLLKPGDKPTENLLANKEKMIAVLSDAGVEHVVIEEPSTNFSVGYALPTINYAKRVNAGCIAIMSHASNDHRYIADADKERLLTNEPGIPILCQ